MKNKEDLDFTCPCKGIKKIVIAMCDINQRRDRIAPGSLACVTFRALMHENFPEFTSAVSTNNTYCACPECGELFCTCNGGIEGHDDPEEYAAPFPTFNRMDRFPVKEGE